MICVPKSTEIGNRFQAKRVKSVYTPVWVDTLSHTIEPQTFYIIGKLGDPHYGVALRCPCGCGNAIAVEFAKHGAPITRFVLVTFQDGRVSLGPVLQKRDGCRSAITVKLNVAEAIY